MSDISNKFWVGVSGKDICFMKRLPFLISKSDALNLAAWLVAIADESDDNKVFNSILREVQNT